jgi:hypothetical protein
MLELQCNPWHSVSKPSRLSGRDKKIKSQSNVLPLHSLRGGRPTRLDTILSNRVASSIIDASSGDHRTGAKYDLIAQPLQ